MSDDSRADSADRPDPERPTEEMPTRDLSRDLPTQDLRTGERRGPDAAGLYPPGADTSDRDRAWVGDEDARDTAESDVDVPFYRTPIFGLVALVVVGLAAILAVAAYAPTDPTPIVPTTAPTATAAPGPTGGTVAGPLIAVFQVTDGVSCSGPSASVPVSWATRDASAVQFAVDGRAVAAAYPTTGSATVPVPCDGREHRVLLTATGEGAPVAATRTVTTTNTTPPAGAPSIPRFDLLGDVTCTGATADVPAAWVTQDARAVSFSVDGQPLPAGAGFPVTGVGRIAVPCDGKVHTVTLTASGSGPAVAASRSVATTVSPPGPPTPPITPTAPVTAPTG